MAYSYVSYLAADSQTNFPITFNYLADTLVVSTTPAGILVYVDEVKQTSGYSVVGADVVFDSAVADGATVLLLRATPRGKADRLVDFVDATVLTESQLDTSALQLLYIAQEAFEQSSSGGSATPTYLPYSTALVAWDAEDQKIARVADPTGVGDATSKGYVDDGFLPYDAAATTYDASRSASDTLIDGVADPSGNQQAATKKYVDNVAEWGISGVPQSWKFDGDGNTNNFTLTGAPYAEAEMLVVGIDGVLQLPIDDFTVTAGAENSTLVIDEVPAVGTVINVQNFGRARFLDAALLKDDSITSAMLQEDSVTATKIAADAVGTSEIATDAVGSAEIAADAITASEIAAGAVGSSEIATDAVTSTELADDTVAEAHMNLANYVASAPSSSTDHFLKIATGTTVLSHSTLTAADITDFNSTVTGQPISAFGPATTSVNLDGNFLLNVPTPTSSTHAATKGYVDGATQSAMRGTLIADVSSSGSSGTLTVEDWHDTKYLRYEVYCYGFAVTDDGSFIAARFSDSTGTYWNDAGTYSIAPDSTAAESGTRYRNAALTPNMDDTTTDDDYATFQLTLINPKSTGNKYVQVRGIAGSRLVGAGVSPWGQGSGNLPYAYSGWVWSEENEDAVHGIRFLCIDDPDDTATSGLIRAGARVLVYGFEGLS
jgi:hypothetical protein